MDAVNYAKRKYDNSKQDFKVGYWKIVFGYNVSASDIALIIASCFFGIGVIYLLFIAPICYLIEKNKRKKSMNEAKQAYKEALSNLEKPIPECKKLALTVGKLDCQIDDLSKTIDKLKNDLKVYYQAGIIPPDYRRDVCVVIIDYVFRNDQADTMREATLICDQHIRHLDLMKALADLAKIMIGMTNLLSDINDNISEMSQEVREIADNQSRLMSKARLTRYAAESTAKSAEYTEWCVRNHI